MAYKFDAKARYAKSHEWVRVEGDVAVIGVSDYAQHLLSDVVYVELPEVGDTVDCRAGDGHRRVGQGRRRRATPRSAARSPRSTPSSKTTPSG